MGNIHASIIGVRWRASLSISGPSWLLDPKGKLSMALDSWNAQIMRSSPGCLLFASQ